MTDERYKPKIAPANYASLEEVQAYIKLVEMS